MQIIDVLLDIGRTPKKPQYIMAPEIPLVLHSCEFSDLQFFGSAGILTFELDLWKLSVCIHALTCRWLNSCVASLNVQLIKNPDHCGLCA